MQRHFTLGNIFKHASKGLSEVPVIVSKSGLLVHITCYRPVNTGVNSHPEYSSETLEIYCTCITVNLHIRATSYE